MKNYYFKLIAFAFALASTMQISAQTIVTIPAANPDSTGANASMERKPYGTNRAYERSAMKYTHTEIGLLGTITDIAFYCDTINNPGKATVKIYMKDVSDSTFATSSVAIEETGATLVFDDTISASSFVKDTWVNVTLSTPFSHFGNSNVEVIVETNSGGTAGTDLTTLSKGFRYTTFTQNRFQYWQSGMGSGAQPGGPGTTGLNRTNVQFTITPLTACAAPPTAGTALASSSSVCSGSTVNLSLAGNSIGLGLTYQWLFSTDSVTWTPESGAISSTYNPSITAAGHYACVLTCSGMNDTSISVFVGLNPFYTCYCTTGLGGNCAVSAIDSVAIVATTMDNPNTGCAAANYISYPAVGNTTAQLVQGQSYTFVTRYTGDVRTSLWIDYNHNGIFENNEWTQLCTTSVAGSEVATNVTIPITALTGMTGMRIRSRVTAGANDSTTACTTFGTGETEDYMVDITTATLCSSPPAAGTLQASSTAVCLGEGTVLSLSGNSSGLGITYQWLSSADSVTWIQESGATQNSYSPAISSTMYYTCVVTCSGSSSDTAAAVLITLNPFYDCYCTAGLGGNCAGSAIDSVAIVTTTMDNPNTGCAAANYISYPAAGNTTAQLVQGQSYTFVTRYTGDVRTSLWIDYNHNGVFENNEWTQLCTTSVADSEVVTSVTIPITALTGMTGMRIRSRVTAGVNDSTTACATFGTGETEDYMVDITAATLCSSPPTAGTLMASSTAACLGETTVLNLIGNSSGLGITYQWLSSTDNVNWVQESGATQNTYSPVFSSTIYYTCVVTCSGSSSDTAAAVLITLNPFYMCYCSTGLGGNCNVNAIDSVSILTTTLANGPSNCAPGNYIVYPLTGNTTANLVQGYTYTFVTKYLGNERASVWIDYDHNGIFDISEWTQLCTTSVTGTEVFTSVTIPVTASTGLTGMRIRSRGNTGQNDSTSACANFVTGEIEDYLISIDSLLISVGSVSPMNTINVYPNPVTDNLQVTMMTNEKAELVIYDLTARKLIEVRFTKHLSVPTSDLVKGVYLYEIKNNKGILKAGKIIKN